MTPRGRLFRKYVIVFAVLVSGALLASGAIEVWSSYQENKAALVAVQRQKALNAATRIEAFIKEIERQIGWTTQPQLGPKAAATDQRRVDYLRLLRQAPAITEISHLDAEGREQLRVSRLAMDVVGSGTDFSGEPKFREARAGKIHYGPVYFRKESEPYMTIAIAGSGQDAGVTVAEVNLKFIWDVVSQIKVGKAGQAFVVDGRGALIAHPDISLVLQKTSFAALPQVKTALAGAPTTGEAPEDVTVARDIKNQRVLTDYATITPLKWAVFIEQPLEEAFEPLQASVQRTILLIVAGIVLSVVASLFLARRMVTPIQALQAGAARIGAGDLAHRLEIRTGDELEALAEQFNSMTAQLRESYATLEQKVEDRTRELTESLEQQTATSEILRVISSSPTDVQPVFDAIVQSAARLCEAEFAALFLFDGETLGAAAHHTRSVEFAEHLVRGRIRPSRETTTRLAALERRVVHVHDLTGDPAFSPPDVHRRENVRTALSVPMLREQTLVGVITTWRSEVRPFTDKQVELVKTFADQAVIAIENVRLFTELEARTRDLGRSVEELRAMGEIG
ncbi:MAG: GAF domain-containing protein, partial [Candidatus Rokubacteria bacterium]|nr:GAF domain-containing protein [Candidatus Rokubacteria bacterium]